MAPKDKSKWYQWSLIAHQINIQGMPNISLSKLTVKLALSPFVAIGLHLRQKRNIRKVITIVYACKLITWCNVFIAIINSVPLEVNRLHEPNVQLAPRKSILVREKLLKLNDTLQVYSKLMHLNLLLKYNCIESSTTKQEKSWLSGRTGHHENCVWNKTVTDWETLPATTMAGHRTSQHGEI